MTIEDSNRLRNSWRTALLTSNKLTPFQIMDLENIKEEDKVSIELLDYHNLNSQLRQLFNDGKYDSIISRLSKLPIAKAEHITLKVKMPTGKTISYSKYLKIAAARMDNNQEPLKVEFIAPKHKSLSKPYATMPKEEFMNTIYGQTRYNENGQITGAHTVAFKYAWEELIEVIAKDNTTTVNSASDYFNPVKLADWLNNNPCEVSTLFFSESVFFGFLQWLADNSHIDRKALAKVNLDMTGACEGLHKHGKDDDLVAE